MKKFTKKEENLCIKISLEQAQKCFIAEYGFKPALKDMHPLECSFEVFHDTWICSFVAFHVGGIGYTYTYLLERNEVYDMKGGER